MRNLSKVGARSRAAAWITWLWLVTLASTGSSDSTARAQSGSDGPGGKTSGLGSLTGVIHYQPDPEHPWKFSRYYIADARQGLLAECVVVLEGPDLAQKAPAATPLTRTIDQVNFQFVPETSALRTGDTLKVINSDDALHNVMTSDGAQPFNVSLAKGQEFTHRFAQPAGLAGPIRLGCLFHGSMHAWVFVFDHPWFAVTGRDGRFQLMAVPLGRYTLAVLHPAGKLRWTQEISLKPGTNAPIQIRLSYANRTSAE
ncbi:MAG TPA: carboxypeptidase regulatory-like domain-containing protein [Verrucomicrobiae bacterium]|nr:carboxypeptidase regulatory-like domain-containing protein [Verrucomicrobiae bacterium]